MLIVIGVELAPAQVSQAVSSSMISRAFCLSSWVEPRGTVEEYGGGGVQTTRLRALAATSRSLWE
jgi:hypothetical protein